MRTSIERLRIGLLVGAGLLVLVIAAFLGYARYKVHRALVDLPGKLGATITKEFNGYTYSQSDGKRTIFTIHAAKAVQHKDGNYSLHDVNMVLYGKKGDRSDHITGDDFEYDTKEETVRAVGIVHLDLQAPEAAGANTSETAKHLAGASAAHDDAVSESRVIHVKTSGLVYLKKLGMAATKEGIEFAFGGFTGRAIGAEYNSDSGHVILQSAITVSGLDKGRPIALAASHGELDRATDVAAFNNARYTSAGQVAQAEVANIHLRSDGTVERIEGERHVLLEEAGQGSVASDRADLLLDTTSKPKSAVLTGSVRFVDDEPLRQARGNSDRTNLAFDPQGRLDHAVLIGRVHATEKLRSAGDANQTWSQRDLTADTLDLGLVAADANARPQLREVKATGSARMTSVAPMRRALEPPPRSSPATRSPHTSPRRTVPPNFQPCKASATPPSSKRPQPASSRPALETRCLPSSILPPAAKARLNLQQPFSRAGSSSTARCQQRRLPLQQVPKFSTQPPPAPRSTLRVTGSRSQATSR